LKTKKIRILKTDEHYVNLTFSCLGFVSEAVKLGITGLPVCRSYTFEELKEATKNFDNSAFMGEGSYGKVLSKTSNLL
jgi:hypothetical protein